MDLDVPDARRPLRGAAEERRRGGHDDCSPSFNRWLDEDWGCNYEDRIFAAPYISLCDVDWAVQRARVGAVARRARHRHAPGRADDRVRPALTGRPDVRPVLGARERGRASPSSSTPATAVTRRRATPSDGFGASFDPDGAAEAVGAHVRDRARRLRLPHPAHVRRPLHTLPEPPGRVGRERLGVPARPVQEAGVDPAQDAELLAATTRPTSSASTAGSTRSGRTTPTRSPTSWAPTA